MKKSFHGTVHFLILFCILVKISTHKEAEALPNWKSSLISPSLASWTLNSSNSRWSWTGIRSNEVGSIVKINLADSGLDGTLARFDFSAFPNLASLDLDNDNLVGEISAGIGNPTKLTLLDLGSLRKLQRLNLRIAGLNSNIPEELGLCTNLTFLEISSNSLTGPSPLSMAALTQIREIGISDNHLSGELDPYLRSNWTELISFQLQINDLSGTVPPVIGSLHKLYYLYLFNNNLSGPITPEMGNLSNLLELQLANNFFSGSIPSTIASLSSLTKLSLSNNQLSGNFPPEIGNMESLEELDLSTNQLQGTLPSSIINLRNINLFYVAFNNFSGSIPEDFARTLPPLVVPPSALQDLISLQYVDISYNNLEGPLPDIRGFQQAPALALAGNPGLCGENAQGLSPCSGDTSSEKHKSNRYRLMTAITIPLAASAILLILIGIFIFQHHSRADQDERRKNSGSESSFSLWNYHKRIDFRDIFKVTESFDNKYCIGRGGQGSVYKAKLPTGNIFAVKCLHPSEENDFSEENQMKSCKSEMHVLTEIRHRNFVKMHGFSYFNESMFFVYEFVKRASLGMLLQEEKEEKILYWDMRLKVIKGAAHALSYLHHDCRPAILHTYISEHNIAKPTTISLSPSFQPKPISVNSRRNPPPPKTIHGLNKKFHNLKMGLPKNPLSSVIPFTIFAFFFNPLFAADITNIIYKDCADQNFQDPSGIYSQNLKSLLSTLVSQSADKNFSTTITGDGQNAIMGLYQCRGDLATTQCYNCVSKIPDMANKLCSKAIAARVQLSGCSLRYEVVGYKQVNETELLYKICGSIQVSGTVFEGCRDMAFDTATNGVKDSELFYTGSYKSVYVLGQCEDDLASGDCEHCFKIAFERAKSECGDSSSGQIYLHKCYISYSYYPNGVPSISSASGKVR